MPNVTATRQLSVNVTLASTWIAASNLATGFQYIVPTVARTTVNGIRVSNLGGNTAVVELAISADGSPTSAEQLIAPTTLLAGESMTIPDVFVLPATYSLWIRVAGTSPNVTLAAGALEYMLGVDLSPTGIGADPAGTAEGLRRRILHEFKPADNEPPSVNAAASGTRNQRPHLAFDTTTQETAVFSGVMPYDWDPADGLWVIVYAAATSAVAGTIGFDVTFERIVPAGIDMDADSWGTPKTITAVTVPATAGVLFHCAVLFAQADLPASLAPGDFFRLRLRRDVASDTAVGDAEVYRVQVEVGA